MPGVHNVETLANIPPIILQGAAWYQGIGTEKSKGTKVFALAGKINNVGLVEVPLGTSLREIIYEVGGASAGGASSRRCRPAALPAAASPPASSTPPSTSSP